MDESLAETVAPESGDADAAERARTLKREQNRRYRAKHPEQLADSRRRWVEANREHVRELNRRWREDHLEHARELNRESMRRAAARKRRRDEQTRKTRERVRAWRAQHPDRVREYRVRWVAANRDKMREYSKRYYEAHRDEINARATARRDADPDRHRDQRKEWASRNKDHLAELQRMRRADPAVYQAELEATAAAKRLKRRLARAGLPPKQLHRTTASERRANERGAEAFFADPALGERSRQAAAFTDALTKQMTRHGASMRQSAVAYVAARERMGLPPVQVDDAMWAQAVDVVIERSRHIDRLTSRDVAGAVRASKAALQQKTREQQHEQLVRAVVAHVVRNRPRLEAEAELENRARAVRGRGWLEVAYLVVQLALEEVVDRLPDGGPSEVDLRRATRTARYLTRMGSPLALRPHQRTHGVARLDRS
ncbi:hypothetical protein [Agromyces italicus]|uniref:hypothetical protein n=1 Tax=Agromyces italicus TaxID=279572 RepID=UPI0003B31781|nr:hypothetical protein [Agromyces italicus]